MIGYGNSVFLRTAWEVSGGVPPVNTVAPAITGTAQEGQTVTCSTGTWTGTPTITFAYQWKRNGSNIGSATNSTYTLVTADVSQSITCQVTATNGSGSASATSNTITPIASLDPDAQAFITAAAITNPTQQAAINTLVVDLKGYSVWTKMKALYPFVTDKIVEADIKSQMKFNLKDPRDLDVAFRLFWNGGGSWNANGYTPNGINGWANTYLVAQETLGLNSTSFGVYSRTNLDRLSPSIGNLTGAATAESSLWLRSSNLAFIRVNGGTASTPANADSRGLILANRVNSTQVQIQIRGTQTTFTNASNSLSTNVYQLGGVNPNFFDTKQLAFAFIGDGLTSQNMTDMNTAVIAFQTALSRNV
jgi:hypothetical protein